jgi:hypothetical protein
VFAYEDISIDDLWVQAGTQFHDIQQFTVEHDLQFVGGSDQSVGAAGGWAQVRFCVIELQSGS